MFHIIGIILIVSIAVVIANLVTGVTQGYTTKMEIFGVGYRVQAKGSNLEFALGYSHPVLIEAPEGITSTGDSKFNRIWSLFGVPCVTVPAFKGPKGLPVGVQIVGPYGSDAQTLYWAEWVQRSLH